MEIDYALDQLSEQVLEEIFAFIPENENLRLACKTFKDIIDNSPKLMKDKWLIVDNALDIDPKTINHYYQKLIINDLSLEVLNWMFVCQFKDRIKEIKLKCSERHLFKSANSVQYILSHFNSLRILHFDAPEPYDRYNYIIDNNRNRQIKFICSEKSKLETLKITYFSAYPNNILQMFSRLSTIKSLIIGGFQELFFPSQVEWLLEQLIISNVPDEHINNDNVKEFLLSQQSSLRKFIFPDCIEFSYFIMRNLPNIEELTLSVEYDDQIDDDLLLRNDRLQRLNIVSAENYSYDEINDDNILIVLKYYRNVKYLSIIVDSEIRFLNCYPSTNQAHENLTHLMLKGERVFRFLDAHLPNLKVLALIYTDEWIDFDYSILISRKSLKCVDKLTVHFYDVDDVLRVLPKCLNLTKFNLKIREWNEKSYNYFITSINKILSIVPNIKCLGIVEENLKHQNITVKTFLNQISNKQICLKIYDSVKSMIAEDWGQEHTEYMKW